MVSPILLGGIDYFTASFTYGHTHAKRPTSSTACSRRETRLKQALGSNIKESYE
jgi:hypothetical protein